MLEQESEWPDDESVISTIQDKIDWTKKQPWEFEFGFASENDSDMSEKDDNEVSDNNNTMSDSNNNTMSDDDIE